jgi:1-aminocyclopropane-1-carboxylate deaminase/D-cysteine desulfhydrase-like pyridoxal-dependent ACC family enzyme
MDPNLIYDLVLFLHVGGVLGLFAGSSDGPSGGVQ